MLVITELDPGGAERVVYDIATRLDPARFSAVVVSLDAGGGLVGGQLREAGVSVVPLGGWRRNVWGCARRLASVIAEREPDLVHAHLFHANIAARLAVRGAARPVVLTHAHTIEWRFRPWHYWLDAWTARYCRAELCVSAGVRDHQARHTGLPLDFFRVVPNGIDLTRFRRADAAANPPHVVAVGRMRLPEKGFDVLLRAWPDVLRAVPDARLTIAGDGPLRPKLDRQRSELPDAGASVSLPGYVHDVPSLLAGAAVFCMPSRWEGSPLAAIEAMAAGLPIVGSRIPALTELLDDGTQAMLVPRDDPPALAGALIGLLQNPDRRRELGQAAAQRAASHCGVERMITTLQEAYDEALERRARVESGCG